MRILFWIQRSVLNSKNQTSIQLRISIDSKRVNLSTSLYVEPSQWSQERQRVKGSNEVVKSINTSLDTWKSRVLKAHDDLIKHNKLVTVHTIKNKLLGTDAPKKTLMEAVAYYMDEVESQVGVKYSKPTFQKFKTIQTKLRLFLKSEYKRNDIYLVELSYQFISDFDKYMRIHDGLAHNGVIKNMQQLRRVVNACIINEWIEKDPFKNYKMNIKETERGFLTKEELRSIEVVKLGTNKLQRVRDIFIFSCYTGISFVDVCKLTKSHIVKGVDDRLWIELHRSKTGTKATIPLLKPALKIIDKYKDDEDCLSSGRLLPVRSAQKVNLYLKDIARECNIHKRVSFHLARHTFATTVTLTNGVDIMVISKMLGHKSVKETQRYSKVVDMKIASAMEKLDDLL